MSIFKFDGRILAAVTDPRTVRAALAYFSFALMAVSLQRLVDPHSAITGNVRDVVMVLIGAIISQCKEVFGFFFGTSQSSVDKNSHLTGKKDASDAG